MIGGTINALISVLKRLPIVSQITNYNYEAFTPENYLPLMRFDESPSIGVPAPDFPLWRMEDQSQTHLSEYWSQYRYLVVEFGSFT